MVSLRWPSATLTPKATGQSFGLPIARPPSTTTSNTRVQWTVLCEFVTITTVQLSPTDPTSIKATLIQLLFRLNRQQSSNDKYKRKKKDDLSKPHRPQNEHTSTPVISSAPTTQHAAPHIGTSAEAAKYTISTFALSTVPPDLIDPALPITGTGESEADPYLIPESPTFGPNDVCLSLPKHTHKLTLASGPVLISSQLWQRPSVEGRSPEFTTDPLQVGARNRPRQI